MKNLSVYILVLFLLSCGTMTEEEVDPAIEDGDTITEELTENLSETEEEASEEEGLNRDLENHGLIGSITFKLKDEIISVDNSDVTDIENYVIGQINGELNSDDIYQIFIHSLLTTNSQSVALSLVVTDVKLENLSVGDTIKQVKFENVNNGVVISGAAGDIVKETYILTNDGLEQYKVVHFSAGTYRDGESYTDDLIIVFTKIDHIKKLISGVFSFTAYDKKRDEYIRVSEGEFTDLSWR